MADWSYQGGAWVQVPAGTGMVTSPTPPTSTISYGTPAPTPAPAPAPSYSAPAPTYSAPTPAPAYSAPASTPAPASAPSAPKSLLNVESATQVGRLLGLLSPTEVAQGGLLAGRVQNASPEIKALHDQMINSLMSGQTPSYTGIGGVVPIGQEPLSQWEREGLTSLANGTNTQNQLLQKANDLYAQISQQLNKASTPMSDVDFNQLLSRYQNPFQQQVVNQSVDTIRRDADKARARLMTGSAAFGSSSQDRQLSELERSTQDAIARATSGLNYEGFNNLVNTIENRQNSDRSGALQAASTGLGAASGIVNLGQTMRENTIADIMSKIGAGGYVRDYNQQLADKISGEYGRKEGYDSQKLKELMTLLSAFKEGQTTVPAQPNSASNWADRIGALGSGINSIAGLLK